MPKEYKLIKITTETYLAVCKVCKKPFSSDVKEKAIKKVMSHYQDKCGR